MSDESPFDPHDTAPPRRRMDTDLREWMRNQADATTKILEHTAALNTKVAVMEERSKSNQEKLADLHRAVNGDGDSPGIKDIVTRVALVEERSNGNKAKVDTLHETVIGKAGTPGLVSHVERLQGHSRIAAWWAMLISGAMVTASVKVLFDFFSNRGTP